MKKDKCLSMLSHQMQQSYNADTSGFEDLNESALLTILKLETLDLFVAVNGWAVRRCTKKNVEITGPNLRKV